MNFLTTKEIEETIKSFIETRIDPHYENSFSIPIHFEIGFDHSVEGTYVFSDEEGYHYLFTEKGRIGLDKVISDLKELIYEVLKDIIFNPSSHYAAIHDNGILDYRRKLFEYKLNFFYYAGEPYYNWYKNEIEEILKVAPYSDKIKQDDRNEE